MIKEITVFTEGDSTDINVFSNVPYFFCRTLEEMGIKVNRINISISNKYIHNYNKFFFFLFIKLFKQEAAPFFGRSLMYRYLINKKIKKASKIFPNSEMNLFLTFKFINRYSSKPNIQWCDWTERIEMKDRNNRSIKWFEKLAVKGTDKAITDADVVYSMFPNIKKRMEQIYKREIRYLDKNVINTLYDKIFYLDEIVSNHHNSKHILFIGRSNYKEGCLELINIFKELKLKDSDLILDIIGMNKTELGVSDQDSINCYGYLDKNKIEDRKLYYELIFNAKVYVNPSTKRGGYGACVEAMYYGCPVIVYPYTDFVENFGKKIDFGYFITLSNSLKKCLSSILNSDKSDYISMSQNAHNAVKNYTWKEYVETFFKDLNSLGII